MCNNTLVIDSKADTPQTPKIYCDVCRKEIRSGDKYRLGLHGDVTCLNCVLEEMEEME